MASKKQKQHKMPQRSITCEMCGYVEMVDYSSSKWFLNVSTCPKCLAVEASFPELFKWIIHVVDHNRLTRDQVEDIADSRISRRDNDGYY